MIGLDWVRVFIIASILSIAAWVPTPAVVHGESEDRDVAVDIQRESVDGDMDRDGIHYGDVRHDEVDDEMEPDLLERLDRDDEPDDNNSAPDLQLERTPDGVSHEPIEDQDLMDTPHDPDLSIQHETIYNKGKSTNKREHHN